jgi:CRISPR/Cas system CMR-associated protein Cmr1 (group 7 of RAMP superfamily)
LKSKDPYIENCFHASLKLFCDYHRIGGKSARGLGDIDLSELEKHIDLLKVKAYYQHLEGNKEEIRRYITGE